jgi:hypothetical protein
MSILNFVDQDQLDNLDDDPRLAFMELVNLAQRSLSSQLSQYRGEHEEEWREMEDLRHSFMNVIVASSKRFEIEPFSNSSNPILIIILRSLCWAIAFRRGATLY